MEDFKDGLTANEYVDQIAAVSEDFYGLNNLLIHKTINPSALSLFIPPIGESYVVMEMEDNIDLNVKASFTIANEKNDVHQLGCFKVIQEHDEDPVYIIKLEVVGNISKLPTDEGYLVKSLIMNSDGIYEKPTPKSLWDLDN